jgi:hypothetical protein
MLGNLDDLAWQATLPASAPSSAARSTRSRTPTESPRPSPPSPDSERGHRSSRRQAGALAADQSGRSGGAVTGGGRRALADGPRRRGGRAPTDSSRPSVTILGISDRRAGGSGRRSATRNSRPGGSGSILAIRRNRPGRSGGFRQSAGTVPDAPEDFGNLPNARKTLRNASLAFHKTSKTLLDGSWKSPQTSKTLRNGGQDCPDSSWTLRGGAAKRQLTSRTSGRLAESSGDVQELKIDGMRAPTDSAVGVTRTRLFLTHFFAYLLLAHLLLAHLFLPRFVY